MWQLWLSSSLICAYVTNLCAYVITSTVCQPGIVVGSILSNPISQSLIWDDTLVMMLSLVYIQVVVGTRVSDLGPKYVKLAPNGTNQWLFHIKLHHILTHRAHNMYWKNLTNPNVETFERFRTMACYGLYAQKWTSVNCVKESTHKIFTGLQYELITIAPNHYPRPIKSVV